MMLNAIIKFSIQNKLIIGLMITGLVIWGSYSVTQLPIDAVPDITNNQVQVLTVAPSQSALDIERYVTFPVEQAMATIPQIEEIRSFCRSGISVVTMVFTDDPKSYPELDEVVQMMKENPKMEIQLEGHTDNVGSAKANLELSQSRVDAVKKYLTGRDIAKGRIQTKAFGGTQPLRNEMTPEARAQNRRVEMRILKD